MRILCVAGGFPPARLPVAPAVAKWCVGLAKAGAEVEVVAIDPSDARLERDDTLLDYVESAMQVTWLRKPTDVLGAFRSTSSRASALPDPAHAFSRALREDLSARALDEYDAVLSFAPFHSINTVLAHLKHSGRRFLWFAHLSDPWSRDPLRREQLVALWSRWAEPALVRTADRLLFTTETAARRFLAPYPNARANTGVLPHSFDRALFPPTRYQRGDKFRLRHVGQFLAKRSPVPLFAALELLLQRRPELAGSIAIDLFGSAAAGLLAAPILPHRVAPLVRDLGWIAYRDSLGAMAQADLLALFDVDDPDSPFLPGKIGDYFGAVRPLLPIVADGATGTFLDGIGITRFDPKDIVAIAVAVESSFDAWAAEARSPLQPPLLDAFDNTTLAAGLLTQIQQMRA